MYRFIYRLVIHPTYAQEISEAAVRDGSTNRATQSWANLGAAGAHVGNIARDFESIMAVAGWSNYVEPYTLPLSFRDGDGRIHPIDFPILLPHEMLHAFYKLNPEQFFDVWVGSDGVRGILEFWERSFEHMPFLRNHPYAAQILETPSLSIPYRLWGDEAPVSKHHGLGLFSISSCLTSKPSMLSRLLMFLYIAKQLQSFDEIWDVITWSLTCCAEGVMPSRDHLRQRYTAGSGARFRHAGEEIAGGSKFFLTQVVGDIKHLCETFGFDSAYHKEGICFLCRATRSRGLMSAFDYRTTAGWTMSFTLHEVYMRDTGRHLKVTRLPGFNLGMLQLDMMHILALGLLQVVIGCTLWELCASDFFLPDSTGPWKERFSAQLLLAFHDFKEFCRTNGISESQRPFTVGRLSLTNLGDRPLFKGKAANTLKVAKWLCQICISISNADPTSDRKRARSACLWGYVQFVDICRCASRWLTDSEVNALEECRQAALFGHSILASLANSGAIPRNLWATKPKCHYFDHLARKAQRERLNPCNHWVFCDEDFIGRIVTIVRHVGGSSRRLLAASLRYLVRMHLAMGKFRGSVPVIDSIA